MGRILPTWFRCIAWSAIPGAWALALRIVWEGTILTARQGPQMIGFTLLHNHPTMFLLMSISAPLALLWSLTALTWIGISAFNGRKTAWAEWMEVAVTGMPLLIIWGLSRIVQAP